MTNEVFTDKRLLGALDYIDERFIAEVTESYTFEAPGEYKRDKKTVFRAYRQFAALAACLLLLSAAFPVLNYAVQRFGTGIWEGNAGAGTEELEMPTQPETQALETENEITETEVIDSGFDKYLEAFANMSADEIYAEVMKGGWCVQNMGERLEQGIDLWFDFLDLTSKGDSAVVLFANYNEDAYNPEFYSNLTTDMPQNIIPGIYLTEIFFDGNKYTQRTVSFYPNAPDYLAKASEIETKEYAFLYASEDYHRPLENVQFILSNDESVTDEMISNCLLGINAHLYIDLVANSSRGPAVSKKDYNNYLNQKKLKLTE